MKAAILGDGLVKNKNALFTHALRAYFNSAQLAGAEAQLRALIEHDPSDHYAHHVLGRTLERAGRFREALPHLRLAAAMKRHTDYVDAVRRVEEWLGKSESV